MSTVNAQRAVTAPSVALMPPRHVAQWPQFNAATIATLGRRMAWFARQLLGKNSQRVAPESDLQHMHLGQHFAQKLSEQAMPTLQPRVSPAPRRSTRRKSTGNLSDGTEQVPFFGKAVFAAWANRPASYKAKA